MTGQKPKSGLGARHNFPNRRLLGNLPKGQFWKLTVGPHSFLGHRMEVPSIR